MKTRLTQRRIKARKASACGLCKPWKQGGADKKTVRDLRHAVRAGQQLREIAFCSGRRVLETCRNERQVCELGAVFVAN